MLAYDLTTILCTVDRLVQMREDFARLRAAVDLVQCDGCGDWMAPDRLQRYGGCGLCGECWATFNREMRSLVVEEWEPGVRDEAPAWAEAQRD